MKYWLYQKKSLGWRNQLVQAKLVQPSASELQSLYGSSGFHSPLQPEPYGVELHLTYRIDPRHPQPDNYCESAGFNLYSDRLAALLDTFDVRAERFPTRLVDKAGDEQPRLVYHIYHIIEGVLDAMDRDASGWLEDGQASIRRLVLREGGFAPRPIFTCAGVYVNLMREDVRQAIIDAGLTGFRWLDPAHYRSGQYGLPPSFDA